MFDFPEGVQHIVLLVKSQVLMPKSLFLMVKLYMFQCSPNPMNIFPMESPLNKYPYELNPNVL